MGIKEQQDGKQNNKINNVCKGNGVNRNGNVRNYARTPTKRVRQPANAATAGEPETCNHGTRRNRQNNGR